MKILVAGSSGMVGLNILEHPSMSSHEILSPRRSELDLSDKKAVYQYIEKNKPDLVINVAGRVGGIQANIKYPVNFLVENLEINMNLINSCYQLGVRKLINMGSSCIYPRNAANPLTEEMILQGELEPTNEGYAIAKISALRLCQYINRENSEFHFKTIIPCNLYGRFDKFDPKNSHLIPAIIQKIYDAKKSHKEEVDIWGDGTARREFMYAGDVANCVLHAVNNFESLPSLMNLGLGHDHSINEYYQAVAEVVGYKGRFVHDLSKPTGMKQKLVSIDKMNAWGWKAETSLHQGIEKTYQFYSDLIQGSL